MQSHLDDMCRLFVAQICEACDVAAAVFADGGSCAVAHAKPAGTVKKIGAMRYVANGPWCGRQRSVAYDAAKINGASAGCDHQAIQPESAQAAGIGNMPFRPVCCQPASGHFFDLEKFRLCRRDGMALKHFQQRSDILFQALIESYAYPSGMVVPGRATVRRGAFGKAHVVSKRQCPGDNAHIPNAGDSAETPMLAFDILLQNFPGSHVKLADDPFQVLKDRVVTVAEGNDRFLHHGCVFEGGKVIQGAGANIFLDGPFEEPAGIGFKQNAVQFSAVLCHGIAFGHFPRSLSLGVE